LFLTGNLARSGSILRFLTKKRIDKKNARSIFVCAKKLLNINLTMDLYRKARKRLRDFADHVAQSSVSSDLGTQNNFRASARKRLRQFAEWRHSQIGDGVVTRAQQRAEAVAPPETEAAEPETEAEEFQHETSNNPLDEIEQPETFNSPSPQAENETNERQDILFNQETLVAENNLLEAFVVKVLFKRQKQFSFDDHQVDL
jgi:hypothetical protein